MKKIILVLIFAAILLSCGKQDTVYKPFIKEGGYIYPAKPIELTATSGFQRILLEWKAPMDPSIRTTKLFWDNYTDSLTFTNADYNDGVIQVWIDGLDDRSYTFDVVNYDEKGHKSLATEITTTPFGESWLLSHSERSVKSAVMDGEDAAVTMTRSTDEMVATKFRYKTTDGTIVESEYLRPGDVEIRLPKAQKGKLFEFKSAFLPVNGKDTVWNVSWQKAQYPILYKIETGNWTVSATKGQTYSSYTAKKIFDGVISSSSRWHSSRTASSAKVFPKILSIDTGVSEGAEYTFTSLVFHQSPDDKTYRYIRQVLVFIGDTPFDQNDNDPVANFGTPIFKGTLTTAEADTQVELKPATKGRYMAIVFMNTYNEDGYIDLWELSPYGYLASEMD